MMKDHIDDMLSDLSEIHTEEEGQGIYIGGGVLLVIIIILLLIRIF